MDGSRIDFGVSYGGFMAYALTTARASRWHRGRGRLDWRDYDSIYTGATWGAIRSRTATRGAARFSAADLHGELLLVHGALDDNVHP